MCWTLALCPSAQPGPQVRQLAALDMLNWMELMQPSYRCRAGVKTQRRQAMFLLSEALAVTQVLSTAESNKELIRIDPLQRLHTLTNLSELLAAGVQGIAHTLRDDQLQSQAEDIRQVSSALISPFTVSKHDSPTLSARALKERKDPSCP